MLIRFKSGTVDLKKLPIKRNEMHRINVILKSENNLEEENNYAQIGLELLDNENLNNPFGVLTISPKVIKSLGDKIIDWSKKGVYVLKITMDNCQEKIFISTLTKPANFNNIVIKEKNFFDPYSILLKNFEEFGWGDLNDQLPCFEGSFDLSVNSLMSKINFKLYFTNSNEVNERDLVEKHLFFKKFDLVFSGSIFTYEILCYYLDQSKHFHSVQMNFEYFDENFSVFDEDTHLNKNFYDLSNSSLKITYLIFKFTYTMLPKVNFQEIKSEIIKNNWKLGEKISSTEGGLFEIKIKQLSNISNCSQLDIGHRIIVQVKPEEDDKSENTEFNKEILENSRCKEATNLNSNSITCNFQQKLFVEWDKSINFLNFCDEIWKINFYDLGGENKDKNKFDKYNKYFSKINVNHKFPLDFFPLRTQNSYSFYYEFLLFFF